MSNIAMPSGAARTAKNAYTIAGILCLIAFSALGAYRFPKTYASVGDMLSGLVQGITPLAVTIVTVGATVVMAAILTKVVLFVMQFAVAFEVRTQDEADAMNRMGVPFHLKLEMVEETGNTSKFYYTWRLEYLLFVATILQVIFIGRMGYFAHLG